MSKKPPPSEDGRSELCLDLARYWRSCTAQSDDAWRTLNPWKSKVLACVVVVIAIIFLRSDILPLTFEQRILAAHNEERSDLGLEPLSWNPALAQSAEHWADYLASTGKFEHAPENLYVAEGENLWAGTKGYFAPEAMVDAWIWEKRYFRSGVFPDNSTTGKVEDVGHYTQVIWRATSEVGCAEATSADEDILVCRYTEAGNYKGERPI